MTSFYVDKLRHVIGYVIIANAHSGSRFVDLFSSEVSKKKSISKKVVSKIDVLGDILHTVTSIFFGERNFEKKNVHTLRSKRQTIKRA